MAVNFDGILVRAANDQLFADLASGCTPMPEHNSPEGKARQRLAGGWVKELSDTLGAPITAQGNRRHGAATGRSELGGLDGG